MYIAHRKPRPGGLALAFQEGKPGQSRHEAIKMARPIWAWLGLAHGLRPGLAKHYSGISDSGLIAHLSEATAGSLNGVGHSSVYEELTTFS